MSNSWVTVAPSCQALCKADKCQRHNVLEQQCQPCTPLGPAEMLNSTLRCCLCKREEQGLCLHTTKAVLLLRRWRWTALCRISSSLFPTIPFPQSLSNLQSAFGTFIPSCVGSFCSAAFLDKCIDSAQQRSVLFSSGVLVVTSIDCISSIPSAKSMLHTVGWSTVLMRRVSCAAWQYFVKLLHLSDIPEWFRNAKDHCTASLKFCTSLSVSNLGDYVTAELSNLYFLTQWCNLQYPVK